MSDDQDDPNVVRISPASGSNRVPGAGHGMVIDPTPAPPPAPLGPPKLHTHRPVLHDGDVVITRLRVAGGWLYVTTFATGGGATTFVPDLETFGPGS
jgi:hypothetical protein